MTELGERVHDKLIAGDYPLITQEETIVSGQNVVRGTLMGKITASSKLSICDSGNTDGTENPYSIMSEDVDASAADKKGITYHTGDFNERGITFGGTDTPDTHRTAMRALQMHMHRSVSVDGAID